LDNLGKKLNITTWEDWYKVKHEDFLGKGGITLLHYYSNSIVSCLLAIYPQNNWQVWKFEKVPKHCWSDVKILRNFFDHLGKELCFTSQEDWYTLTRREIEIHGGSSILSHYDSSISKVLRTAFPEYNWNFDRFERKSEQGFWKSESVQREVMDRIGSALEIKSWEDWYSVRVEDVSRLGAQSLLIYYGNSLIRALMAIYPEHPWNLQSAVPSSSTKTVPSKSQSRAFASVRQLFPHVHDIHFNYVIEDLKFGDTEFSMEFDIFIPSLKLAFEYHGQQHYSEIHRFQTRIQERQKKDEEKRNACKKNGISLIEIPYSWDGTKAGLVELIQNIKPEVLANVVK